MKKTTPAPSAALPTEEERATLAAAEAATVSVSFADLGLSEPMLEALRDAGYTQFTIQLVPGHEHAIEDWARLKAKF